MEVNIFYKKVMTWLKVNAAIINKIAGFFFFCTLISAVFWAFGNNIEPIVALLSLFSSLFFSVPHMAEFLLPSRKPIKAMSHEELLNFIKDSDEKNDWQGISKDWVSEIFLKEDPRLRFYCKCSDEGIQNENFKEEWANKHADPNATGYWYDLYYDGNLIERFILVSVDGGRARLPVPNWETKKVSQLDYKVAQIHDILKSLEQYMLRSKLEVDHK